MYNPLATPIIYSKGLKLSSANKQKDGLYRIETIPVGAYVKDNAKVGEEHERIPFEVNDDLLLHWVETFKTMQHNGIEVPMPLNHTEDPEARRATVVDLQIDKNKEGKNALYTIFKFRDKEAEKALKDSSVSIYVPPKFVDGKGNEYTYPIRHVAITDYPVIPGLEKMQPVPIAASFSSYISDKSNKSTKPTKKGKKNMAEEKTKPEETEEEENEENEEGEGKTEFTIDDVKELAEKLGLNVEQIPEDKLWEAVNHVIDAIMEGEDEEEDEENSGEKPEGGQGKKEGERVASRIEHKEEHYHPPIAAGFISRERKNRIAEINRLAEDGYLTVPARDTLIKKHCSDEALQLAFNSDFDILDNFDADINLIKMNGKVTKAGRKESEANGGSGLELSYADIYKNPNANPLLADAERRAKAAGQA